MSSPGVTVWTTTPPAEYASSLPLAQQQPDAVSGTVPWNSAFPGTGYLQRPHPPLQPQQACPICGLHFAGALTVLSTVLPGLKLLGVHSIRLPMACLACAGGATVAVEPKGDIVDKAKGATGDKAKAAIVDKAKDATGDKAKDATGDHAKDATGDKAKVPSISKPAVTGAHNRAAQLPDEVEVATRHGASPSAGSELPTPVPQLPTSEGGVSPALSPAADLPVAANYDVADDDPHGAGGESEDIGGAYAAVQDAAEAPASGFEDAQEGTMRATELGSAMRAPGPQAVLQSVDYGRGI